MYCDETRQHVLGLLDEGYPAEDVADIIGCSTRSIRRWTRHYAANGTVWRDPRLHDLHDDAAIRNVDLTHAILTLVESEPAAFLHNHVDLLVAQSMDYQESDQRYVSPASRHRLPRVTLSLLLAEAHRAAV